jgi:hypothetical protein
MGMNPFTMGGGYALPPSPYGPALALPPAPGALSPTNPFADGGGGAAGSGGGAFVGRRMEDDPLNALTEGLLGALPK